MLTSGVCTCERETFLTPEHPAYRTDTKQVWATGNAVVGWANCVPGDGARPYRAARSKAPKPDLIATVNG